MGNELQGSDEPKIQPPISERIGVHRVPPRKPSESQRLPETPIPVPSLPMPSPGLSSEVRIKMNDVIASAPNRTASGRIPTVNNDAPVFPSAFNAGYKKKPDEE